MTPSESFENENHDQIEGDPVADGHSTPESDSSHSSPQPSDHEMTVPIIAEIDGAETARPQEWDVSQHLKEPAKLSGKPYLPRGNAANLEQELQNMSAIGGAVGAFVLGLWSMICSLITYFGFINAIIAILLGVYGLSSSRKRLATIGIILGICGLCMSLMEINEMVGNYFLDQQEISENF